MERVVKRRGGGNTVSTTSSMRLRSTTSSSSILSETELEVGHIRLHMRYCHPIRQVCYVN